MIVDDKKIEIIKNLEKNIKKTLDTNIKNYYSYCTLTYYMYSYFNSIGKDDLAKQYLYNSRSTLVKLLKVISDPKNGVLLTETWYGGVGLLYIMRSVEIEEELKSKIVHVERYIIASVNKSMEEEITLQKYHYDIISGLSGIGLYFLEYSYEEHSEILKNISYKLIAFLETFSNMIWLPSHYNRVDIINNLDTDYSISHGVLGIVYYLSKYYDKTQDGIVGKVIRYYTNIFEGYVVDMNPTSILKFPIIEIRSDNKKTLRYTTRTGWCYGSMGTLRALYLIAKNIHNYEMKSLITKKIENLKNSEVEDFNLECPTFCHGLSSVYYILSVFKRDENICDIDLTIENIEKRIWSLYDDKLPYFFPKYDTDGRGNSKTIYNNISFIDGVTSIAICYLSLHSSIKNDYFAKSLALM